MVEDTKGKKSATLFGGGVMEKINKRIEEAKALSKVKPHQPNIDNMHKIILTCVILENDAPASCTV